MKLFQNLKAKWSAMAAGEKLKMIVGCVCDAGACLVGDALTRKFYEANECGKVKKALIGATSMGLSMYAGSVASHQLCAVIDAAWEEDADE